MPRHPEPEGERRSTTSQRQNLGQIRTARTDKRCGTPSRTGILTATPGKNVLPCDLSRVDRAGTVKPANRGAREILTRNVNTTKQRTQHSHRGRRATEHPNMDHPKAAKTRLQAGRKRAKRLKHEARCPVEHADST